VLPLAFLNIGGVSNVTWVGADGMLIAFDTGPGNVLIDDWALKMTGSPVDKDGRLAFSGRVNEAVLAQFLGDCFFEERPPKSLDRRSFAGLDLTGLSPADGAATLTAFTAAAVADASEHLPVQVTEWLVTGGGRRNPVLMGALGTRLAAPVRAIEAIGWNGDAIEAQAFAYMAVRSRNGLPISFPETSGVPKPMTGGRLHKPN